MVRNLIISAFGAGLVVCVAVSALQFATTEPLILRAESFEGGGHPHGADASPAAPLRHDTAADAEAWQPADGLERSAYTVVANLVAGVAVSLMLLGLMSLKATSIDARRGLLWGIAGFAAASLLPGLGLPPELPGTPAAELTARQMWWLFAALASAGGIALCAFARHWAWVAGGIALLVLPHAVGAPAAPSHDVAYPAILAGEFVVASLLVSAALWSVAGLASGWFYQRLSGPHASS